MRRSAAAVVAASVAATLWLTRPLLVRVALRWRVRRLKATLDALRAHAAAARALGRSYSAALAGTSGADARALKLRVQAAQKIQRRTLAGLEAARALVDANLLQLRAAHLNSTAVLTAGGDASVRECERLARAELATETVHAVQLLGGSAPATPSPLPPRRGSKASALFALSMLPPRRWSSPLPPAPVQRRGLGQDAANDCY